MAGTSVNVDHFWKMNTKHQFDLTSCHSIDLKPQHQPWRQSQFTFPFSSNIWTISASKAEAALPPCPSNAENEKREMFWYLFVNNHPNTYRNAMNVEVYAWNSL